MYSIGLGYMEKYLALYIAPAASIDKMISEITPVERKAGMDEWATWMKDNAKSLVDMGAPAGKTKKVTVAGAIDIRNEILGYSVVQADSLEEAAKVFQNSPQLKMSGGSVEVMELMPVPEM